jgi:hypothetical protein
MPSHSLKRAAHNTLHKPITYKSSIAISEAKLGKTSRKPSSPYLHISATHRDKQPKMQEQSQDWTLSVLSTSLPQLPLHTVWTPSQTRREPSSITIWEEEPSKSPSGVYHLRRFHLSDQHLQHGTFKARYDNHTQALAYRLSLVHNGVCLDIR